MDNNQRGCFAEYLFCTECIKHGYNVSMPLIHSSVYDCIVDNGKGLYKIQIKSTKKNKNQTRAGFFVSLKSKKNKYPICDVDYFAVFVSDLNGFFIFKNTGNMRAVRLTLNGKYSKNFNNFEL